LGWQDALVLCSLLIQEHFPLILLVFDVIHKYEPLCLFSLLDLVLLCLDLARVEKVGFFRVLSCIYETYSCLLLDEPLIRSLEAVLLVLLVVRADDLSEHPLQAEEESLHIAEVNSKSELDLKLRSRWPMLPVALCLDEELDQS